jgi:hypothetical protein
MMPSPGIWKVAGQTAGRVLAGSVIISAFGTGKWRLLILDWAVSMILVACLLSLLEFD